MTRSDGRGPARISCVGTRPVYQRVVLQVASLVVVLVLPAAQSAPGPAPFAWGEDVNPGAGAKLVDAVQRELQSFVRLPAKQRAARAGALAKKRAVEAIEGWKRFRNPELIELARACLQHPDWHVVHRALTWSLRLQDPTLFERAWGMLGHPEPRMREIAALTCLQSFAPDAAAKENPDAARTTREQELSARFGQESDFHVRQALLALKRRLEGELEPRCVSPEVVVKRDDGLLWAPFVRGLGHLEEIAPGVVPPSCEELGRASLASVPVATRWNLPIEGFGKEEVPRIVMQPFGKPRKEGALFHTGQDVGGCCDGAGLYAIGDGIVRMICAGSDMGTGIVVEHRLSADARVNAVYMHGCGTLFVKSDEVVRGGQLLGTVGLSFSVENGGQFAHLHFGLYPGPFDPSHNYGYKPAQGGLEDWLDPAVFLPRWIAGDATLPPRASEEGGG